MRRSIVLLLTGIAAFSMAGCVAVSTSQTDQAASEAEVIKEDDAEETEDNKTGMANPWTDITEEEAAELIPDGIHEPDGATNVIWSRMDAEDEPLVQLSFDLDGMNYTVREQITNDDKKDISGMYYEWTVEDEVMTTSWGEGILEGKTFRYIGEDEFVDLITWYNRETGVSYSLSTSAKDLDGFDIQGIAEAVYDPGTKACEEEELSFEEEHIPMDITGCDTFTQIVDKLPAEAGFANVVVNDVDVLLVTEYIYDYEGNETYAAIDSEVYYYNEDGIPTYAGFVTAGGTAYPLSVKDGKLYAGGNHYIKGYTLSEGKMVIDEEAYVEYDANGEPTYYVSSDIKEVEAGENGVVSDDTILNRLYDEYFDADMIVFSKASN